MILSKLFLVSVTKKLDQLIYGRLLEMCTPVRFTGDDFRRAAAQQKKERLKELMMENKAVQAEEAGL